MSFRSDNQNNHFYSKGMDRSWYIKRSPFLKNLLSRFNKGNF